MRGSTNDINILEEKEAAKAVHVEDVGESQEVEPSEIEPRMNLQTVLAYMVLASQYNAYVLTLLIPSTTLSYINADLGPDPNYTWIMVYWGMGYWYDSKFLRSDEGMHAGVKDGKTKIQLVKEIDYMGLVLFIAVAPSSFSA
ncbi:hypothetical protein K469DRAFT_686217 [Zopfia rhizophila CBS 207.26]|uniref:Uncharacterized protein n=1 Tax=Zopfia rhizophila CBS 207.26 TaxID=1314779 RepID=A0A6A6EA38_9PEZI|nr:hypothetical protein K469DRAFT_686217 [Zopfia rhizophila CBS 207.26]